MKFEFWCGACTNLRLLLPTSKPFSRNFILVPTRIPQHYVRACFGSHEPLLKVTTDRQTETYKPYSARRSISSVWTEVVAVYWLPRWLCIARWFHIHPATSHFCFHPKLYSLRRGHCPPWWWRCLGLLLELLRSCPSSVPCFRTSADEPPDSLYVGMQLGPAAGMGTGMSFLAFASA